MKLSVILPVRNQTDKLLKNIKEKIIPFFDESKIVYDIVICSDGSNEEEEKKLEDGLKELPMQVKHVPYSEKRGKGLGVKRGILFSESDYCLFMDADLSTDLSAFNAMKKHLKDADAFIGSRELKESKITEKQTFVRRLTHFGSIGIIKMMFHFKGISDTQCGFKMFRTDVAKAMASRQTIDGFAFDVEYLYFLKLNGFKTIEVPVIWENDADSSVSAFSTSVKFFKSLFKIKHNKKNYILSEEEKKKLARKGE